MDGDKTAQFCKWLLTYCIKKQGKSMIPKAFSFVEVANYLGMHPVTVSRIARKLRETGILARVCLLYTSCHTHSIYDNRTSVFRIFISKVLHMSSYACNFSVIAAALRFTSSAKEQAFSGENR